MQVLQPCFWICRRQNKTFKLSHYNSLQLLDEGGNCQSLLPCNWWQSMWERHEAAAGEVQTRQGKTSLLWGWSNTGTGFPVRCLMPHACWCSSGIWIMLSVTFSQPWRGHAIVLNDLWRALLTELFYSMFGHNLY